MKKILLPFICLFSYYLSYNQSFNSPESVDYDAPRNRWIVGQNGSGQLHILNAQTMGLTTLVTGIPSGPHGVECVGDTVFCCDGATIKGYSLLNGSQVSNLNLGATFLNGLTWDGGDFLYATDFSAKKIFKYQISTGTYTAVVSGLSKSPNGIIYDGDNNRCVFVNWGTNAPIMAMDLTTYNTSTLMNTTLSNCDGITKDPCGNWYVSAWGGNKLVKINPDFSGIPTTVLSGLSSPADIDINTSGDTIAIPNSGSGNNVSLYVLPTINFNASFTQNNQTICAGDSVVYTDLSTGCNITDWKWTFTGGNPTTSLLQNPTVFYANAGSFDVKLVVTDEGGSKDSVVFTNHITVNPLPSTPIITQLNDSTLQSSQATGNQWNNSGGAISGETSQTFQPSGSGDYTVTYTDVNGCSSTSAPFTFTSTLGIGSNVYSGGKIYPNPSLNELNIILDQAIMDGRVILTDLSGKMITIRPMNGSFMIFERGSLPAGTYVIMIYNFENETVLKQRVVFID